MIDVSHMATVNQLNVLSRDQEVMKNSHYLILFFFLYLHGLVYTERLSYSNHDVCGSQPPTSKNHRFSGSADIPETAESPYWLPQRMSVKIRKLTITAETGKQSRFV